MESILWQCPECHILKGVDMYKRKGKLIANCASCGMQLRLDIVPFIDQKLVQAVLDRTEELVQSDLMHSIRFRWLSQKTVGIVIEDDEQAFLDDHDTDLYEHLEEELAEELGITVTLIFEE